MLLDQIPQNVTTPAYAASLVASARPAALYGFSGYNSGPAQFIQVHDAASLPADTEVPKIVLRVAAQTSFSFDAGRYGRWFQSGIVVCNSSTGPTKTIAAADCWFDCQFS